jgi:hypothetical protein
LNESFEHEDEGVESNFHPIQLDPLCDLHAALTRHSVSDTRVIFCMNPNHQVPMTPSSSSSSTVGGSENKDMNKTATSSANEFLNQGKDGLNILRQIRNFKITDILHKYRCTFTTSISCSHFLCVFYPLFRNKVEFSEQEIAILNATLKENRYKVRGTMDDARGGSKDIDNDEGQDDGDEDDEDFENEVIEIDGMVVNDSSDVKKKKKKQPTRLSSQDVVVSKQTPPPQLNDQERLVLQELAERLLDEPEFFGILRHGHEKSWITSPTTLYLCTGGINKLNSLRYQLMNERASLLQKNLSAFGNLVIHNARLVRNNMEQLSLISTMSLVTQIDHSEVLINWMNRVVYDCSRVLLLEKAQPDAGYLVALKFPFKRNELLVREGLQRLNCMDEALNNVSSGIAELVGRLCSVVQAMAVVEEDELLLLKDASSSSSTSNTANPSMVKTPTGLGSVVAAAAASSSSSSFSLNGMLTKSKRQVHIVTPMIEELLKELNLLRKIRSLRLAGRHVLDFPQPVQSLSDMLAKELESSPISLNGDGGGEGVTEDSSNHLLLSLNSKNFVNDCEDLLLKCIEKSSCEYALTQAEESVAALLDLQAAAADTCNEVNLTRTEIRRNLIYLNDLVDRLGMRDDDAVSELLRDITESSRSALKLSKGYDRTEERLLQSLLQQILDAMDSVTAIATSKGEKEAFDQIVTPMLSSLRQRIEAITEETSQAVLSFRNAPKMGFAEAFSNAETAVSTIEALVHQSGQSENCIRMLTSATDAVCELEQRNSECVAQSAGIEKQKTSCRRRLLPAMDAMRRLTKRLELDPMVGDESLKARADAVEALEAARHAIDAHGSY